MNTTATKIEKQVASLQSKIDGLSGPHLTNTPKRQREQRQRDTMIERYRLQIHTLQYLAEETACRDLTPMEQGLLVGAFHEDMRGMLARMLLSFLKRTICPSILTIGERQPETQRKEQIRNRL